MSFLSPFARLALITLLLSGCAHQFPKAPLMKAPLISEDWPKHQAQVQALDAWVAVGKLGIKVPNDGGSASLRWQHQANEYQIDLNGPFGSGKLTIVGTAKSVSLTEAGKPPETAKSAEDLIRKSTGWNIPVTQLAFWVRGLPDPKTKITHFTPNSQGLLGELEQLGWKITYGEYLSVALPTKNLITPIETLAMPGRIIAEYQDVRLTLVIREWSFGDLDLKNENKGEAAP
jgi:outer membrane lipoprotein LolB